MERTPIIETSQHKEKIIKLFGWVNNTRRMGKIIFVDLRDKSGLVQVVCGPEIKGADELRSEFVVEITGKVVSRSEKNINTDLATGRIEVQASGLVVLAQAKTPPFEIAKERTVEEETRLKYRYLDLRLPRMKRNLILRHKVNKFFRTFLDDRGFTEVETPILSNATPEGARDYLVPSRIQKGNFYALPQAPQQFKQLLMVAGLEKYYQIARCFRDEDTRGDRQPEFTQLDIELSFVTMDDIMKLTEKMFIELVKEVCPDKKITLTPFPRLSYADSLAQYQTDKPDLRKNKKNAKELAFCWVINPPLFEFSENEKKLISTHHPFTAPIEDQAKHLDKKPENVLSQAYDIVLNGYELGTGSIRIHDYKLQEKIFKILGLKDKEIKAKFGHLLEAFSYGVPPHGGIAPGIDRVMMILAEEPNIREVIAFPKTSDARDLMMGAPAEIDKKQLGELGIEIKKK
ncbi:MAG: aspartate--tRNA ligase [Patescibacteria group bacterium]